MTPPAIAPRRDWSPGRPRTMPTTPPGRLCAVGATTCASPNLTYDSAGRTATWSGWTFAYDAEAGWSAPARVRFVLPASTRSRSPTTAPGTAPRFETASALRRGQATTDFGYARATRSSSEKLTERSSDARHRGAAATSSTPRLDREDHHPGWRSRTPATTSSPGTGTGMRSTCCASMPMARRPSPQLRLLVVGRADHLYPQWHRRPRLPLPLRRSPRCAVGQRVRAGSALHARSPLRAGPGTVPAAGSYPS